MTPSLPLANIDLIELIRSNDRWFVTVWRGMAMQCEREFISFIGAVSYIDSLKSDCEVL